MAHFTATVDFQNLKNSSFPDMDLLNNMGSFDHHHQSLNEHIALPHHGGFSLPSMNFLHDLTSSSSSVIMDPNTNNLPPHVYEQVAHFFSPPSGDQSHVANNTNLASESELFMVNSSSSVSANELSVGAGKNNHGIENLTGKKRKRNSDREKEKPREVVHVRAKRGQATDSHSLAERLRREKINEKLRCLQDLVPGCYKTMGMAVMLDVIINYVRSLQNQIDFLSMKLSAASMLIDFNNPDIDTIGAMQESNNPYEANGIERMVAGEGYGGFPQIQTWPL